MSGTEKKELTLNELESAAGGAASRLSGLPCPQCGGFIPVSMEQLTTTMTELLPCPHCGFELKINHQESRPAIEALKKFQKKSDPNLVI